MGAVSGLGDSYDLPNYVGELFHVTPKDTPFLSMIGGLSGGMSTKSKQFTCQTVDNAAASQPAITEGADATFAERTRSEVVNVCQIHQEGVHVSYTKQAATANIAGEKILGDQPVENEVDFQVKLKLEKVARDVEYSFLQGTYVADTDVSTARKTRGLLTAVSTNTVAGGSARLNKDMIDELLREMADSGAPFNNVVVFANAFQRQRISSIYGYAPESRSVGGLSIKQVETDFGTLGVAYNRHMPTDKLLFAEVSVCKPRMLEIPGKGFLFLEPLAKTGSADKYQIYGEIGLHYGPEQWHGSITGLATS
jgi:hypothetical protein